MEKLDSHINKYNELKAPHTLPFFGVSAGAGSTPMELIFTDDYSVDGFIWNKVGSGGHGIVDGEYKQNDGTNQADRRFWRSLGLTLSDTAWKAHFRIAWARHASNANETQVFALMDGSGQPLSSSSSGDGIMVTKSGSTYYLMTKLGTTVSYMTGSIAHQSTNVWWYAELERTSATNVTLKMFTSSANREAGTNQQGSTLSATISSSLGNLTHLHHGNSNPIRTNTTYIDYMIRDTYIYQ